MPRGKRFINLVFEDRLSLAFMERLLAAHADSLAVRDRIDCQGFGRIKASIAKYNQAAPWVPAFVLTDLDRAPCASAKMAEWLPGGADRGLLFRIAVREVEAWLLADRAGFARLLGVSAQNIPQKPDELDDPKQTLFSIVRRSRKRDLKDAILPGPYARIGPDYNVVLPRFVRDAWSPDAARARSPSLERAIKAIEKYMAL